MASLSRPMQADPGHKGRAAMPGGPRSLPRRPSLRYLKLEAKRRLAAGEFAALHDAQAAIAWEHGLPNWTALKQLICGQAQQQSHALAQVRWVIARFRDAGEPGWIAPDDDELRLHFDDQFLSEVPAAELIAAITSVAADLREEPTVIGQAPLSAHIQIGGLEVFAAAEANPPHRLTSIPGQVIELRFPGLGGHRGGNRKRRVRPSHQGIGTSRSAKPASMRTGWWLRRFSAQVTPVPVMCRVPVASRKCRQILSGVALWYRSSLSARSR